MPKSPAQLDREIEANLKIAAMKRGETVVTNDEELDMMGTLDELRGMRSLPNPDRVGIKDQYIAWIGPKKPSKKGYSEGRYRAAVYVEGASKPVHVSPWASKASAEHAAQNHRAMIRDRGWNHIVRVEKEA
jgi:hypothetical protein